MDVPLLENAVVGTGWIAADEPAVRMTAPYLPVADTNAAVSACR